MTPGETGGGTGLLSTKGTRGRQRRVGREVSKIATVEKRGKRLIPGRAPTDALTTNSHDLGLLNPPVRADAGADKGHTVSSPGLTFAGQERAKELKGRERRWWKWLQH